MIDDPAAKRVLDALSRLDTARQRADNTVIGRARERIVVTESFLERLARSRWASAELRRFAAAVSVGESTWDRIEIDPRPVPPEVSELRADPSVDWPANWPIEPDDQPYRIPWQ